MRRLLLFVLLCVVPLSACNKNKRQHVDNSVAAAEAAERHLGAEERIAREHVFALSEILEDNIEDGDRAEARLEAYLFMHRDELIRNTRALEANLNAKSGEAREIYEERFSDYMAPALSAWYANVRILAEKHPVAYRRVARTLKTLMNRQTGVPTAEAPEKESTPMPEPAAVPATKPSL